MLEEFPDAAFLELDSSDLDDGYIGGRALDASCSPISDDLSDLEINDDVQGRCTTSLSTNPMTPRSAGCCPLALTTPTSSCSISGSHQLTIETILS